MWLDVDIAITVPVNIVALMNDTDFKTIDETIAFNESGMDLNWNFITTNGVITQTNVTPTSGGVYDWTHVGNGMYKIEIPDSGGGSINNDAEGYGWFSGIADNILPFSGPVIGFRAAALNNALVDGGDNLDVNVTQYSGTNVGAPDTAGFPKVTIKDGAGQGEVALTSGKVDGVALVDVTTTNSDMVAAAPTANQVRDSILDDATRFSGANIDAAVSSVKALLPAALVGGRMSSDVGSISTSTEAADNLEASAETIVIGAAIAGTLSNVAMTTNLTETRNDQYNGRRLIWTSGILKDQATAIEDFDGGAGKLLTYTQVNGSPGIGDTFNIV